MPFVFLASGAAPLAQQNKAKSVRKNVSFFRFVVMRRNFPAQSPFIRKPPSPSRSLLPRFLPLCARIVEGDGGWRRWVFFIYFTHKGKKNKKIHHSVRPPPLRSKTILLDSTTTLSPFSVSVYHLCNIIPKTQNRTVSKQKGKASGEGSERGWSFFLFSFSVFFFFSFDSLSHSLSFVRRSPLSLLLPLFSCASCPRRSR